MKKKGFSSRLLRKYRLTIHNENKLENVLGFYISPLWVILSLFLSLMLVVGVIYLVIMFTPVGSMLPGYVNKGEKDKIVSNSLRVDSLMHEIEKQDAYAFLRNYMNIVNPQKALANSNAYLEEIAKKDGVKKTESGLLYEIVREGNPEKMAVNDADQVRVMYEGKLKNGKVFDSSYERGDTITFALNQVIKGWSEGMKLVGEGGEIKLWIPSELGYGMRAPQQIGPNQALAFTVELVEVIPAEVEEK